MLKLYHAFLHIVRIEARKRHLKDGKSVDSAFGVMLGPGQHRPRDPDHAVERGRQAMRLRQRLQRSVQFV